MGDAERLAKIEQLAWSWYEGYDQIPANDPRNPSDVDIAYDDAGYQILCILGKVEAVTSMSWSHTAVKGNMYFVQCLCGNANAMPNFCPVTGTAEVTCSCGRHITLSPVHDEG
jgi:hypothetical protein